MLCHHTQVRGYSNEETILVADSVGILLANIDSGGPEMITFQHSDRMWLQNMLANKIRTGASAWG